MKTPCIPVPRASARTTQLLPTGTLRVLLCFRHPLVREIRTFQCTKLQLSHQRSRCCERRSWPWYVKRIRHLEMLGHEALCVKLLRILQNFEHNQHTVLWLDELALVMETNESVSHRPYCLEMWALLREERMKERRISVEQIFCVAPVVRWSSQILLLTGCYLCSHSCGGCFFPHLLVIHDRELHVSGDHAHQQN